MKRYLNITAWTLAYCVAGYLLGAVVYAFTLYLMSPPPFRPHTWVGWDIAFYLTAVGIPLSFAALGCYFAVKGRLPGTSDSTIWSG